MIATASVLEGDIDETISTCKFAVIILKLYSDIIIYTDQSGLY